MASYGILEHGMMVGDARRVDAYLAAIHRAVGPGSVVVDIGSGTGLFAVAACQAGASRVYAIEPGDVIQVAREVAAANGCAARISFIQRFSTEVTLPERADVIVLDVRGVLPDEQIPVVADARRRFLKPGGTVIPASDTVWVAPISAPDLFSSHIGRWQDGSDGFDLTAVSRAAAGRWYKCRARSEQLIGEPRQLATLEYLAIESDEVRGAASWIAGNEAIGHGFIAWFDTTVSEGLELSNAPSAPPLLYGNGYFPWPEPVEIGAGEEISIEMRGGRDGNGYDWQWTSRIAGAGKSFMSRRLRPIVVPDLQLTVEASIDRQILDAAADEFRVGEIAREVAQAFPRSFKRHEDAVTHVVRVLSASAVHN